MFIEKKCVCVSHKKLSEGDGQYEKRWILEFEMNKNLSNWMKKVDNNIYEYNQQKSRHFKHIQMIFPSVKACVRNFLSLLLFPVISAPGASEIDMKYSYFTLSISAFCFFFYLEVVSW